MLESSLGTIWKQYGTIRYMIQYGITWHNMFFRNLQIHHWLSGFFCLSASCAAFRRVPVRLIPSAVRENRRWGACESVSSFLWSIAETVGECSLAELTATSHVYTQDIDYVTYMASESPHRSPCQLNGPRFKASIWLWCAHLGVQFKNSLHCILSGPRAVTIQQSLSRQ